jgi:hypothetical protein
MRHRNYAALAFACWLLAACGTLGIPKAESFNDKLLNGYTAISALADTTATLYAAGKISDADKDNVVDIATNLKTGLDVARQLHQTSPDAADDKLAATIVGLTALQNYLISRSSE